MNDDGMNIRECDQKGCQLPATRTLVWDEHKYYCPIHVQTALRIAESMGFPTPARTVRKLTALEMIDGVGGDE
jgi:hypothetical protein